MPKPNLVDKKIWTGDNQGILKDKSQMGYKDVRDAGRAVVEIGLF